MNKIILLSILLSTCQPERFTIVETETYTTAKFTFVNQTKDTILFYQRNCFTGESGSSLPRDSSIMIFPDDTVIFYDDGIKSNSLENYNTVIGSGCVIRYGIGSDKCDHDGDRHLVSFAELEHYEVKKEVSENNYEFVYYLTEAKKEAARPCKL